MKLKMMIMGLGGVVGLLILFGVITGMLRISILDNREDTEHQNILAKLEKTGNLELIHYNFDETPGKTGNTNSGEPVSVGGEAAACINLRKVRSDDIQVQRDKIIISLPSPELCYAKVTKGQSEISSASMAVNKDTSMRTPDNEEMLRKKAVSLGIYDMAKENAEKLVHALLSSVTDKEIILEFKG